MSGDGHITAGRKEAAQKRQRKPREWFERKVAELGESLNQLPEERQDQFQREMEGAQSDAPEDQEPAGD